MAEEALDNFELELELSSKAPLAQSEGQAEEDEEWEEFETAVSGTDLDPLSQQSTFGGSSGYSSLAGTQENLKLKSKMGSSSQFGGSLEDLVESFDLKISECFRDLNSDVSDFAPISVRSQEETLAQSRFWKDLTSSFGTVLPVDWSKTVIRNQLFLPILDLKPQPGCTGVPAHQSGAGDGQSSSDDELCNQLDMHAMIASHHQTQQGEVATADEVIKEIDAMMQIEDEVEGSPEEQNRLSYDSERGTGEDTKVLPSLPSPLYEDKLQEMSTLDQLEIQAELERLTQQYSETLVQELALRDELQFEKEVKNTFISELIKVQNKRRHYAVDRKRNSKVKTPTEGGGKYLTTVIPYEPGQITTRHMQIMIKILAAINEDSPTTTTLLTDYILKVLCPKDVD